MVTALGYGTTCVAVGDAVCGLTDWFRDGAAVEYVAWRPGTWRASPSGWITNEELLAFIRG